MSQPVSFTAVIPVFNDWEALRLLLKNLDVALEARPGLFAEIILVDDGSTVPPPRDLAGDCYRRLRRVELIELAKNLGHQRALCVGLVHANSRGPAGPVVVMDADGEDNPADVPALLDQLTRQTDERIVFAERQKRAEGIVFRAFYHLYVLLHYLLVGFGIRIGNFSAIPARLLKRVVMVSEIWNHYAAGVVNAKLPYETLPLHRAKRLIGESRMTFHALVAHGLSAISVYSEKVGVRLLIASSALGGLALAVLLATLVAHFAFGVTIGGWTAYAAVLLLIVFLNAVAISLIFTFVVLHGRAQTSFLPARDCPAYIANLVTLFPAGQAGTTSA